MYGITDSLFVLFIILQSFKVICCNLWSCKVICVVAVFRHVASVFASSSHAHYNCWCIRWGSSLLAPITEKHASNYDSLKTARQKYNEYISSVFFFKFRSYKIVLYFFSFVWLQALVSDLVGPWMSSSPLTVLKWRSDSYCLVFSHQSDLLHTLQYRQYTYSIYILNMMCMFLRWCFDIPTFCLL